MRIERQVGRGAPISLIVDGETVGAFDGETLAAVLLDCTPVFRRDSAGRARGMFCNMGTCGECQVTILPEGRRVRACLVPARDGLVIARG